MISIGANKAVAAMIRIFAAALVLLTGLGIGVAEAGFHSPDKTYVAVAFDNHGRAVTLNFIVVHGPEGWVIANVESAHDSLRMFLAQYTRPADLRTP
jgi:hypothetical protein